MVKVPPLPGVPALPQEVAAGTKRDKEVNLFDLLNRLTPEELGDLYIWLAEHPYPGVDPVNLVIASINGLQEKELPELFDKIKSTMSKDLWEILTNA